MKQSLMPIFVTILCGFSLLLQGCATNGKPVAKQEAMVCPQCKMVEVKTGLYSDAYQKRMGISATAQNTIHKHTCPGCQGVLMTFIREGKWKHKCTICEQKPFVCPMIHPENG